MSLLSIGQVYSLMQVNRVESLGDQLECGRAHQPLTDSCVSGWIIGQTRLLVTLMEK